MKQMRNIEVGERVVSFAKLHGAIVREYEDANVFIINTPDGLVKVKLKPKTAVFKLTDQSSVGGQTYD